MANVDNALFLVLQLALLALIAWALVDAAIRPAQAFPAASKQTKGLWLAILVVSALATYWFGAFSLFGAAAAVAGIVYLVDVRPAVRALRPGGPWG